ncbi:MAG TPA: rhomboid family intramembrane serine protease [Gemmatimonadales bacterium]|nr:rhomboid family intramembrane serine protease [Gemmatimonadales bacterium]
MTPWVTRLLLANGAMFLLTAAFPVVAWALALVPGLLLVRPWTVVTYMFLHADPWHLLFNMLGLFFFGPRLESRLGSRKFLMLYLISGVAGALLSVFTPRAAIVGASGALFGVYYGFAHFWPRDRILVWGIIPVEARVLVIIMTVLALYGGMTGGGGVAHLAHLGGFVGGFLYLRLSQRYSAAARFRALAQPSGRAGLGDLARWRTIHADGMHPVNRAEYDRVMKKISDEGVSQLTPSERAFLDRFVPA